MNKWQIEVQKSLLDSEEAAIKELERQYTRALKDINDKIKLFDYDIRQLEDAINADGLDDAAREVLKSQQRAKVYQKQYQEALKGQISGVVDNLHAQQYATIDKYLKECYTAGFVGTMYDISKQGIPLIMPIDQAAVVKAVLTDSKVKEGFYNALGVNYSSLKKSIAAEVSRGIASGLSYAVIARNIDNASKSGLSNAKRIARTEGHRIAQTSADDARRGAISRGCDVVKQWDAALDSRTRDSHARVDGEIREEDEKFSNGLKFPGDPSGSAAEVINCRCVALTRARWALDESELETLKERAEYFGLDKSENFKEFEQKYLDAANEEAKRKYDYADTIANPSIKTPQYRKLYDNLDEITEVRRVAAKSAREMLDHRSGTKYEDLTFIDSKTGKFLTRNDYNVENQVLPNKRMRAMVATSEPRTIIALHNHPGSSIPSIADINTAYARQYKYGLIACHDGTLMRYEVTGEYNAGLVDFLLDRAQKSIYNGDDNGLKMVLDRLKDENIILEVFK